VELERKTERERERERERYKYKVIQKKRAQRDAKSEPQRLRDRQSYIGSK
jgi:hypothetical protein